MCSDSLLRLWRYINHLLTYLFSHYFVRRHISITESSCLIYMYRLFVVSRDIGGEFYFQRPHRVTSGGGGGGGEAERQTRNWFTDVRSTRQRSRRQHLSHAAALSLHVVYQSVVVVAVVVVVVVVVGRCLTVGSRQGRRRVRSFVPSTGQDHQVVPAVWRAPRSQHVVVTAMVKCSCTADVLTSQWPLSDQYSGKARRCDAGSEVVVYSWRSESTVDSRWTGDTSIYITAMNFSFITTQSTLTCSYRSGNRASRRAVAPRQNYCGSN